MAIRRLDDIVRQVLGDARRVQPHLRHASTQIGHHGAVQGEGANRFRIPIAFVQTRALFRIRRLWVFARPPPIGISWDQDNLTRQLH